MYAVADLLVKEYKPREKEPINGRPRPKVSPNANIAVCPHTKTKLIALKGLTQK